MCIVSARLCGWARTCRASVFVRVSSCPVYVCSRISRAGIARDFGNNNMEKNNPLLPFAFTTSLANEKIALSTDPREKHVIDENAGSMYHTRSRPKRPVLATMPAMKRKMGESFSEKDDVKRRDDRADAGPPSHPEFELLPDSHPPSNSSQAEWDHPAFLAPLLDAAPAYAGLPSSPPAAMADVTIPDSPEKPLRSPKRAHYSSEADFGIDQFNRYTVSSLTRLSSEPDLDDRAPYNRARQIILRAFEDVSTSVSLESMHLTDIPHEVKDLNNLVVFDDRPTQLLHQLYLTNNRLSALNPALFSFTKLNVLSLRQNRIRVLPPAVARLVNLTDLNIASNRLPCLPPQILALPRLQTFRAGPNPFIPVPADAVPVEHAGDPSRRLKYVAPVRYLRGEKALPSLRSYCLDAIARYDVTYTETKSWKKHTPRLYHALIAEAISMGKYENKCNECDMILVEPCAEAYEWWDVLQNTDIPIKRELCSGRCVKAYEASLLKYFELA